MWPIWYTRGSAREKECGMGLYTAVAGRLNLIDLVEGWVRGALAGDIVGHRIALPYPESSWWEENPDIPYWCMGDVKRLLGDYHIYTYAHGFDENEIWTHCKQKQARWAEYLLQRAGAPVIMAEVDGRNVGWATDAKHGGAMPARWDDREPKAHVAPTWSE